MKEDENVMRGKIDITKIPKGHTPHRSGSGKHKNWRKEKRQDAKLKLKRDNY